MRGRNSSADLAAGVILLETGQSSCSVSLLSISLALKRKILGFKGLAPYLKNLTVGCLHKISDTLFFDSLV